MTGLCETYLNDDHDEYVSFGILGFGFGLHDLDGGHLFIFND